MCGLEEGAVSESLGIVGFGAYVPPLRVSREEIAAAHAWVTPGLRLQAKYERSVAGWDEDAITMAVEAARDCLNGIDRAGVRGLYFGTTTAPFADRLNSGLVAAALGLDETVTAQDTTGSPRAGASALLTAFDAAASHEGTSLCAVADRRTAAPATTQELRTGHGGAAILVARGAGLARLLGTASLTVDFVDHYRTEGAEFDYYSEARWLRDAGYLQL